MPDRSAAECAQFELDSAVREIQERLMSMGEEMQAEDIDLSGVRVLVIEDDYFIAEEMQRTLTACGAHVIGPIGEIDAAIAIIESRDIDCAILDLNLHGTMIFELAATLRRRAVPFLFATGYDEAVLPEALRDVPRFEKPVDLAALLQGVRKYARTTVSQGQHSWSSN
jgi:DNA-binding response OmpR family regulator